MELSSPKKLNKTFKKIYTAQASRFLIQRGLKKEGNFLNTVSENTFGTIPLSVQYLYDLRNFMPRHWSTTTFKATLPREAEDVPRGSKYPKDVPLPHS